MLNKALAQASATFARVDKKALVVISTFIALVMAATLFFAPHRTPATTAAAVTMVNLDSKADLKSDTMAAVEGEAVEVKEVAEVEVDRDDVLWLARGIYSETKKPHEQELVAWVIRNRVETEYRGSDTYEEVVLDPWQFSAFNSNSPKRRYFTSLDEDSDAQGFQTAVGIAERVLRAEEDERPFKQTTRHFYSEQSMRGGRKPAWAQAKNPVRLQGVEARRFRFYSDIG